MTVKESPHEEYDRGFSNGWDACVARAQPAQAHDLVERCREILAWKSTGLLPGNALRSFAKAKWGDDHMALSLAESDTVNEALEVLVSQPKSSTPNPVEVGTTVQAGQMLTDDEIALVVADCAASAHRQDDFSFARAIEQAVLAKRVSQWLPIETAPQDWGVTKFDAWANDARFADCWWGKATYEQGEPGIVYQSDYDCNGPVDSYVRNATHWMPLPPPPGIVGEKGGA